jgi:hypothetical protein
MPKAPSLFRRLGFSFLLGFGLFTLGAVLEATVHEDDSGITSYLDDLIMGVVAGLVVFTYEQRRSRDLRQKLTMISSMNHHVRNALQTISYVPYTEQAKQMLLIQQSVNRIQWALQEILPGESHEASSFPPAMAMTEKPPDTEPQTGTSGKG